MGTAASRCLRVCEGGKKEVGEQNLEESDRIEVRDYKEETNLEISKAKNANLNLNKFVEDNECKF